MKRVIFTILLASTATAFADDVDDARSEAQSKLSKLWYETRMLVKNPFKKPPSGHTVNDCAGAIAKAKAAGVPSNAEFAFIDIGKLHFSRLQADVCTQYERAYAISEALQLLETVKDGKQCASEMDRLLKFGIGDEEFEVRDVELKLADAKAKICEPLAKGEPVSKEEKEKARAAAAVPYEEAGITGAKLKICIANTTKIRLEGGATVTPRDIRRASLLFVLNNPAKDKYELTRIEFKGDEIAKISEKTFSAPPVAADYR